MMLSPREKQQRFSKINTAYRFSFFAVSMLLMFTLFNLKFDFYIIAMTEMIAAGLWVAIIKMHQYRRVSDAVVYHGMILIGFVVFDVLFWRGGYANAGIFWMLGFPFLAYFFAGSKGGSYWSATFIAVFVILQILASYQLLQLPYPKETIDLIPTTLFVFSALAYLYEQHREHALQNEQKMLQALKKEIQQHQKDQHDLQLSQDRIKAMMSDMREAVFQLNVAGHVLLVSPSIERITYYTPEQVCKMSFTDLFVFENDRLRFHKEIHHYGQIRNFKVELKSANETCVFSAINARITYDEQEKILGIEGIISDTTLVEQSEKSMRLLIGQLKVARDTARASNQEKTDFLSLVSHELRTPIHGLMGMQEMLMMDSQQLTQEQQTYLHASQRATQTISNLIHDMLSVSDDSLQTQKKVVSRVELAPFLCGIMNQHSDVVKEKGLGYQLHLQRIPQVVTTDAVKLGHLVSNLLLYAIKQARQGMVVLRVQVEGGLQFQISYVDAGLNKSGAKTLNLMDEKKKSLEMSMVYSSIASLGANLHAVQAEKEQVLVLTLPLLDEQQASISLDIQADALGQIHALSKPQHEKMAVPKQKLRILLAEDDKISRLIAVKRLKRAGFFVMATNDGQQAWDALQQGQFDVLLTDIRMPALDGLALTQKIRAQEQGTSQHLYIIGLSAHALPSHVGEYLKAGMDDFLSKPIEPSQLIIHLPQHTTNDVSMEV